MPASPSEVYTADPVFEEWTGDGFRPVEVDATLSVVEVTMGLKKAELMRLLQAGRKTVDIARLLHRSVQTVRKYISGSVFQAELKALDMDLWCRVDEELRVSKLTNVLRIQEESEHALARIAELINSSDEGIALRASADILDRNPDTSKRSSNVNTNFEVKISPEQLMLAAKAAAEMEGRLVIDGSTTATELT